MRATIRSCVVCGGMVLALTSGSAPAHETDNFFLPLDRPFADLGSYLDAVHTRAIVFAVDELNVKIDAARNIKDPAERARELDKLHDPSALADAVSSRFSDAYTEIIDIELALRGGWARAAYPGQITAHWSVNWMYFWTHLPIDPRRLVLMSQSSTIKAYGVYFGTDKLSHFHHLGRYYYDNYKQLLAKGISPEEATRRIIDTYSNGGPLAETGLLGFVATGVYSNADLASDYAGFKFFLNLTEPVRLKGITMPPLVNRCGTYWSVSERVRPDSGWFGAFISDHWNEALNPNLYDVTIRTQVRWILRHRAEHIMTFYTQRDARPMDAAYYDHLRDELSSYYGEDYGHAGTNAELMTLGNTCMAALNASQLSHLKGVAGSTAAPVAAASAR